MNAKRSEIVAIADNAHVGACAAFLLTEQACVMSPSTTMLDRAWVGRLSASESVRDDDATMTSFSVGRIVAV
jgi:hypothetical protein